MNRDYTLLLYVHNIYTPLEWYICYNWWTYITIITWKLGFPLGEFWAKRCNQAKDEEKDWQQVRTLRLFLKVMSSWTAKLGKF